MSYVIRYSPLCDTDPSLYRAYLDAVRDFTSHLRDGKFDGVQFVGGGLRADDSLVVCGSCGRRGLGEGHVCESVHCSDLVRNVEGKFNRGRWDSEVGNSEVSEGKVGCAGGGESRRAGDSSDGASAYARGDREAGVDPCRAWCAGGKVGLTGPFGGESVRGSRGENYARNAAARLRKRVQTEERRLNAAREQGRKDAEREFRARSVGDRGAGRVLTKEEEYLRKLKIERQTIQEERKIDKLKSPRQMVEDALKQIQIAEKCAKIANDNKVAAWAAAVSNASAESIAKSSGSYGSAGVGKVETIATSVGSVRGKVQKMRGNDVDGFTVDELSRDLQPDVHDGWLTSEITLNQRARTKADDIPIRDRIANNGYTVGDIINGVDPVTGRSISADGIPYSKGTAAAWVRRYAHLDVILTSAATSERRSKAAGISVAEVVKYCRLKKEFGL